MADIIPTRIPARTLIAIVGDGDIVTEIVRFDHTRDIVRNCRKMVDISAHPEIQVGWRLRAGGIEAPPFPDEGGK